MSDVLKAIRFIRANCGPILTNSGTYKPVIEEIRTADMMSPAKQGLKTMLTVREHESRQGLTGLAHAPIRQHHGLDTAVLDAATSSARPSKQASRGLSAIQAKH
jgi:hypothetical protein